MEEVNRAQTTYGNDYHIFPFPREIIKKQQCCKDCKKLLLQVENIDYETHFRRNNPVPFNLMHKPKPILQNNPHQSHIKQKRTKDYEIEKVRRTRPRVVLSPALPLDDLEDILGDNESINLLRYYPYVTTTEKMQREGALNITCRPLPTSTLEYLPDKVHLRQTALPLPLPCGWAHAADAWDRLQTRMSCNPTTAFWLRHGYPSRIRQGNVLAGTEIQDEIKELARNWKLSEPYTTPVVSYGGYLPRLALGVPMKKDQKCPHEPYATTNQAVQIQRNSEGTC